MPKVGAPRGNRNALKHGFYSRAFSPSEHSALASDLLGDFQDEIALLRILIARVASMVVDQQQLSSADLLSTLRAVTLAVRRLESLSRTPPLLSTVSIPSASQPPQTSTSSPGGEKLADK